MRDEMWVWVRCCGDNKYVYSPGDDADWDNNDMINERDINICDNDQTRDGVMTGLMNTFNKDNDLARSSLWPAYWGKWQLILRYKCLPSKPGWRRRADWLCCVSTLNLVLNLFKQYLRRDPSWCDDEGNKCWVQPHTGVSGWSSDLHTLSICYHRDSAHINIFIFTLTRQGLQPHTHIWPDNGEVMMTVDKTFLTLWSRFLNISALAFKTLTELPKKELGIHRSPDWMLYSRIVTNKT